MASLRHAFKDAPGWPRLVAIRQRATDRTFNEVYTPAVTAFDVLASPLFHQRSSRTAPPEGQTTSNTRPIGPIFQRSPKSPLRAHRSSSQRAPGPAQQHGAVDEADQGIGLRVVPPKFASCRVDVFNSSPAAVRRESISSNSVRASAVRPVRCSASISQKVQTLKAVAGQAEIILGGITQHVGAATQARSRQPSSSEKAVVVGREEPQVEQAGSDWRPVDHRRRCRRHGLRYRAAMPTVSMRCRMCAARSLQNACRSWQPERARSIGQPITGGPAHRRRIGVHGLARAKLPQASIGLVVQMPGVALHALQGLEILPVADTQAGGGRRRPGHWSRTIWP